MLRFAGQPLDAVTTLRDGTHRAASLDDTWARFAPAATRAGITRLADLTGLDTLGIPVFAAIRPLGRSLSTQQGKGITPLAAKVSALMESLETWSAEHIELPIVKASYKQLGDAKLPAPNRRSSKAGSPKGSSSKGSSSKGVTGASPLPVDVRQLPRPRAKLDLDATWSWVEGRHLATDEPVLVPLDSVTLDCVFRRPPVFDVSSNGLASGNVLVEAMLHGLCEVIERDAEAAWRRGGLDRRLVLDTIADPVCQGLIDRIVATGARVFVFDLGNPELATIGCAIVEDPSEPSWRDLGCYQGFGAHLVPEVAIARAITEAAQTRLTYIAGARDDFFPADYAQATNRDALEALWDQFASPCDEPVMFEDLPRRDDHSLGSALAELVELVGDVIAVDLTHPSLKVPVVKVIVPGLATDIEAMG